MSINSLTSYNPLSINGLDTVNINGNPFDPTTLVPYVGSTSTVDLNSQNIKTTYAPTASSDLTNKTYVDAQDALRASLTGNNTFTGTNDFNNAFSAGKNAITATLTATTWNQPYWTAGTGTATYSYNTLTTQGTAYGNIGVSSFTLNSTGLTAGYGQTYQMTITNMVFSTPSSGGVYFEIRQSGTVLYNSGFLSTYTSTTRTFNFAVQANGTSLSIIVYDFAGASSQPYFFFGTITLTALSTTISNPYVSGALQIGSASYPTPTAITTYGDMSITGATSITGIITATGIATDTPATTIGLNSSNQLIKYANPTSVFTGSVSAKSVPYASSANVFANSNIYQNGTNVGIGITNPSVLFQVNGTIRADNDSGNGGYINLQPVLASTGNLPYIEWQKGTARCAYMGYNTGTTMYLTTENGYGLQIGYNSNKTIYIDTSNRVGIQNGSPAYYFDVSTSGSVRAGSLFTSGYGQDGYGQVRMIGGNYGAFFRNDGDTTYFLLTASGDQYGSWNSLRPFYITNSNGNFTIATQLYLTSVPDQTDTYAYPLVMCGTTVCKSQAMMRLSYLNNSVAWSGGTNISYCFYRKNAKVAVRLSGKLSYYAPNAALTYPVLRIYSQSSGATYYYSLQAFINNTYNHLTFPFDEVFYPNELGQTTGWFDVYFYSNGNISTDGNDQLWVNSQILPGADY